MGVWNPSENQYADPVPHGGLIGFLNQGAIRQHTGHVITAHNVFTLSLDIGHRLDRPLPEYEVRLLGGDQVMARGSIGVAMGSFETMTISYEAFDGDAFLGSLLGIEIISGGAQLNFDNVTLTNDAIRIPEPATLSLIGITLLCLAGLRRLKT